MKTKTPSDSIAILTNIILPSETNSLGNIFGGELLSRMDRIGSISARRHAESETVVTASVNQVSFNRPIPMGKIVKLVAKVTRAYRSSLEVIVDVYMEDTLSSETIKTNEGIYTYVAMDSKGKPIEVPTLQPESEEEKSRYAHALTRKELSLIHAGRLQAKQATELKKLFK